METTPAPANIVVLQQNEIRSKNWGVYRNGVLVEGGFFSRDAADDAADTLRYEDYCDRNPDHSRSERRAESGYAQ